MKKSTNGLGLGGILTIAFIVLKLCKVISWSWVWVLCPLWGSIALCVLVIAIAAIIGKVIKP